MNTNNTSTRGGVEEKRDSLLEQVGEMSLSEGAKSLWRFIKSIKLKHIAICLLWCFSILLGGLIAYYALIPILKLLWLIFRNSASMTIGANDSSYPYCFLDRDLVSTIPLSICVAAVVGRSFMKKRLLSAIVYFILIVSVLEVWDYWFIMLEGANRYLGGMCFVVMFIVIPILMLFRRKIYVHNGDTPTDNNSD